MAAAVEPAVAAAAAEMVKAKRERDAAVEAAVAAAEMEERAEAQFREAPVVEVEES